MTETQPVTERRWYAEKHALMVWREDGKRYWQFENNLLILTDPDEIAEFERILDTLGGARSMIKTISLSQAQQLVADYKKLAQPGAVQGAMSTEARAKQVEQARLLGISASVQNIASETVTPPPGVIAADDPNFTPTETVALPQAPLPPTSPVILPPPPTRIVIGNNNTIDK